MHPKPAISPKPSPVEQAINAQSLRVKEALRMVREMLLGLGPRDVYYRLKDLPETDLMISEYCLVKTFELGAGFQTEAREARAAEAELREEVRFKNEKLKLLALEISHGEALGREREAVFASQLEESGREREAARAEAQRLRAELTNIKMKSTLQDELERENRLLNEENQILKRKLQVHEPHTNPVAEAIDERKSLYKRLETLQAALNESEKELARTGSDNKRLGDRVNDLESEVKRLQGRNENYVEEIVKLQKSISDGFERRLRMEVQGIQERHASELELARGGLTTLYERQLAFLKDQKEGLEEQLGKTLATNKALEERMAELSKENSDYGARFGGEFFETRAALKYTREEANRKTLELEALRTERDGLRTENDGLRQTLSVLKGEIFAVQAKSAEELAQLKAENSILTREVKNYEAVEEELDRGVDELGRGDRASSDALQVMASCPTSKKRRLMREVALGQKLAAKEREICDLLRKMSHLELQHKHLQEELDSARRLSELSGQPGSYLVRVCEEKEEEILSLRKRLAEADAATQRVTAELQSVRKAEETLRAKVTELGIKRGDIENIQALLLNVAESTNRTSDPGKTVGLVQKILEGGKRPGGREEPLPAQGPKWLQKIKGKPSGL